MADMQTLGALSNALVYQNTSDRTYTGGDGDYLDVGDASGLGLDSGTISLRFSLDRLWGSQALISKDGNGRGEGQFTIWSKDAKILVSFESATGTEYLEVPYTILDDNRDYHLAVSFGDAGLAIWLDGVRVAAEPDFKLGIGANDKGLVVGGTRAWRNDDQQADALVEGTIGDVMVFDRQLDPSDMMRLTLAVDADLGADAKLAAQMADLAPLLLQTHHASDTLTDILTDFGVDQHGHMMQPMTMTVRAGADNLVRGSKAANAINGGAGDDTLKAGAGDDVVQGSDGNDLIVGGRGRDMLDGGAGEDTLDGGAGDDLLISRADAREPTPYSKPGRAEGDPKGELTNGKLYADQPVHGDDVMTGGAGADIFYFQTLINAKDYLIEKHTRDDGTINWHGVAGENDNLHDHWVDMLGNDTVTDWDRDAGDRLVIEGHTTQIDYIRYGDADGDGVMDHSIIGLYSQQGNAGAHDEDRLGTITVYGDLVKRSDIEHTAGPAYGIVYGIEDLNEAVKPLHTAIDTGTNAQPGELPNLSGSGLPSGLTPVFALADEARLGGADGDYLDVGDASGLGLDSGTISLRFSLDRLWGSQALISKDGNGRGEGQFTIWSKDAKILVSFESATGTEYLEVPYTILDDNRDYHLAVSFGDAGLAIWLDGVRVAAEPDFKLGIGANDKGLVVGGTRAWRNDDQQADALVEGTIGDVMVFDRQLDPSDMMRLTLAVDADLGADAKLAAQMADLAPLLLQTHHASDTLTDILTDFGVDQHGHMMQPMTMTVRAGADNLVRGSKAANAINGGAGDDTLKAGAGDDVVQGSDGNDLIVGGRGRDMLDGGAGEDTLDGGAGDDLLISRADAREPTPYSKPGRAEGDPKGELTNGKLYADQPVHGDDVMTGGAGADIFYFQTLINAKDYLIEKHTRDDGTINWHGVAGENDNLHDHWVDMLGNDTVTDWDRDAGDRLVIEGHTTQIDYIRYGDADGDGVMDHSIIGLYSQQGNAGAHDEDRLGTITVYGDLVKRSDIEHTAGPAYGIVYGIEDLNEAVKPLHTATDTGTNAQPGELPGADLFALASGQTPVFAFAGRHAFSSEARAPLVFGHSQALDLAAATIALSFSTDTLGTTQALFSKDATGTGAGGHITAYVEDDGDLVVRLQDASDSHYFKVDGAVTAGQTYDLALSFGTGGAALWLDGVRVAYDPTLKVDWDANTEALVVGASGWSNTPGLADHIHTHWNGMISDLAIYDTALDATDLYGGEVRANHLTLSGKATDYTIGLDAQGDLILSDGTTSTAVPDDADVIAFRNMAVRVADIELGSAAADTLDGGDGADILFGGAGADDIRGRGNDDLLRGGADDDTLSGGDGNDQLMGETGADTVYGGDGRDWIEGGAGHDVLSGGDHADKFWGGIGDDTIYGGTWSEAGSTLQDMAYFDGDFADYSFASTTWWNYSRQVDMDVLIVTDTASGGSDGYYEGADKLIDIDLLVFADQTMSFETLL